MQKNNSIFFHYAKLRDLEIAFSLIFQFCNTKVIDMLLFAVQDRNTLILHN